MKLFCAAAVVLANFFGEKRYFTMDNDLMVGVTRSFRSSSQALDEVKNARIYAGIHFRPLPFKNSVSISRSLLTLQSQPRIEVGTVQDFLFRPFYS